METETVNSLKKRIDEITAAAKGKGLKTLVLFDQIDVRYVENPDSALQNFAKPGVLAFSEYFSCGRKITLFPSWNRGLVQETVIFLQPRNYMRLEQLNEIADSLGLKKAHAQVVLKTAEKLETSDSANETTKKEFVEKGTFLMESSRSFMFNGNLCAFAVKYGNFKSFNGNHETLFFGLAAPAFGGLGMDFWTAYVLPKED